MEQKKKKLNLKIIIPVVIVIIVLIMVGIICNATLGNNKNNSVLENNTNSNSKGSRSNPYKIGDNISINLYHSLAKLDIPFKLEFKINEKYTEEKGINLMKTKYNTFSHIPIANATFKINGDYDDRLDALFHISYLNENMELNSIDIGTDTYLNSMGSALYTEQEYNVYLGSLYNRDTKIADKVKYIVIEYYSKPDSVKINSIYIEM